MAITSAARGIYRGWKSEATWVKTATSCLKYEQKDLVQIEAQVVK
jgi:hypothetical protein